MTLPKATAQQKLLTECSSIGALLDDLRSSSVFLVADPIAYESSGASKVLQPIIETQLVGRYSEFDPNPQWREVVACATAIRETTPEIVLAVGGGTAIDIAKLANRIAAMPVTPKKFTDYQLDDLKPTAQIFAIPTTAGTGSEATHFAVVYSDGKKYSVAHEDMRPEVAIVDPSLTATLPPILTAHSGLDALCQAIESIWSIRATDKSIEYAREALALTWNNLETAFNAPTAESREAMARGAYRAGQAINLSKTTAPHALSYTLTSTYNIPHGAAVALTLGPMMTYNAKVNEADCDDPRGPESVLKRIGIIFKMIGADSAKEAATLFRKRVKAIGCPTTLFDAGIDGEEDIEKIYEGVNAVRLLNNPRRLTTEAMHKLLEEIQGGKFC